MKHVALSDLSVGTPSAPEFTSPIVNGTEYWVQGNSSVSFSPVSWVTLQSLQLWALNDATNDTISLSIMQTSTGVVQGRNLVRVFPIDDGTKWEVIANYLIGNAISVTRTSNLSTLQFYVMFNSTRNKILLL